MKTINTHNFIDNLSISKRDGEDYIEVGRSANTKLGKYLGFTFERRVSLPYGVFSNVYKAISTLALIDFPESLRLLHLTPDDVKTIKKLKQRKLEHYWVIVTYIMIEKVKNDKVLYDLMKDNKLEYHWYDGSIVDNGKKLHKTFLPMANYTAVIRVVASIVGAGKINDDDYIKSMLSTSIGDDFFKYLDSVIKEAS